MLVAVIDHGSLAAAARRLRRSPPAVTRALAALEGRVGVRLVERSTRRLSVTEAAGLCRASASSTDRVPFRQSVALPTLRFVVFCA